MKVKKMIKLFFGMTLGISLISLAIQGESAWGLLGVLPLASVFSNVDPIELIKSLT